MTVSSCKGAAAFGVAGFLLLVVVAAATAATNPMCVWNQAYQEHWAADSYEDIVAGAKHCYTLVDPFSDELVSDAFHKIQQLKTNHNTVGCYMSCGTCEAWRDDYDDTKEHCVDKPWGEWEGEYFVYDIEGILPHMKARIDQMEAWGCDSVEFDNMDWCTDDDYRESYGSTPGQEFPAVSDCAGYNVALCQHAKGLGLQCMAKNSGFTDQSSDYAGGDSMDAITFESYRTDFNWWSDSHLKGFLDANKPVIIVHYDARSDHPKKSCDAILKKYQKRYDSEQISFLCEAKPEKKYIHYEWEHEPTAAPTTASPLEIFPYKLTTKKGYQSNDQDISVLSTLELTGTDDHWDTYIELGKDVDRHNAYKGVFSFRVPAHYNLEEFHTSSAKLWVNYFGPGETTTTWRFQIRRSADNDSSSSSKAKAKWKWTTLGNSGSMQDWVWSLVEFPLQETLLKDVVDDDNVIKVRIKTAGRNNDVCDIDYLKLSFE